MKSRYPLLSAPSLKRQTISTISEMAPAHSTNWIAGDSEADRFTGSVSPRPMSTTSTAMPKTVVTTITATV